MKKQSIAITILEALYENAKLCAQLLPKPFETKYQWGRRLKSLDPDSYRRTVTRLKKKGWISYKRNQGKTFIELTKKGELEALTQLAFRPQKDAWDGKWRLIIFDIPESSKSQRAVLRSLLKHNGFVQLQASVYIYPYRLNRAAVVYLKQTGLNSFIRILKVEEIDDDRDLRNKFNLR